MSAAVAGSSPESRRRRSERVPDGERASSSDEKVRVKVEPEDDIKDYAETTMNELLGWYGYDKVDTRGINLRNLNNFPSSSSSSSPITRHEDDISEEDTGQSLSPHIESELSVPNSSGSTIICDWCKKNGFKLFTLKTATETKAFCSEPCFSQCRRAAFKKSRVCDWCKHIRHTVNYVDFQDGDHQLQFCSDKCLNQYKMHIFCKETQAYLQMHPHLQEATSKGAGSTTSKLITPDLWLRDCQEPVNGNQQNESRSDDEKAASCATGKSSSSSGELEDLTVASKSEKCSLSSSNPPVLHERETQPEQSRSTDAPKQEKRPTELCNTLTSYLKADKERSYPERKKRLHDNDREHQRKRERISSPRNKANHQSEVPPAHLSSQSPISYVPQSRMFPVSSTSPFLPQLNNCPSPLNPPAAHSNTLPSHSNISGPSIPPGLPPPPPLLNNDFLHQPFNPSYFQPSLNFLSQQQQMENFLRMQAALGFRHSGPPFPPHVQHSFPEFPMPPHSNPPSHHTSNSMSPPNTVMLPYPVIVPLPVPIPIPIPMSHFLNAALKKSGTKDADGPSTASFTDKDNEQSKHADSVTSKSAQSRHGNSKISNASTTQSSPCDSSYSEETNRTQVTKHDKPSYSVTNNDSEAHRMILTRTKSRHGREDSKLFEKT